MLGKHVQYTVHSLFLLYVLICRAKKKLTGSPVPGVPNVELKHTDTDCPIAFSFSQDKNDKIHRLNDALFARQLTQCEKVGENSTCPELILILCHSFRFSNT